MSGNSGTITSTRIVKGHGTRLPTKPFLISILSLDRDLPTPLYLQLYESVRRAIVNQQLAPGSSLPSTRDLAALLDVSRNTVINAFEQLIAEGYLETREKSRTYVNRDLPEAVSELERVIRERFNLFGGNSCSTN